MRMGEERKVSDLVARVFQEFVARRYSARGIKEVLGYVAPEALSARAQADHFVLLAELDGNLAGVVEIRKHSHVSLLFVEGCHQRRGIARRLLESSLDVIRENNPRLEKITVNASPNAVEAYRRLGFFPEGQERILNGIRFQVMSRPLTRQPRAQA